MEMFETILIIMLLSIWFVSIRLLHLEETFSCAWSFSISVAARALFVWLEEIWQTSMVLRQKRNYHLGI
jgi:hypothetical protein